MCRSFFGRIFSLHSLALIVATTTTAWVILMIFTPRPDTTTTASFSPDSREFLIGTVTHCQWILASTRWYESSGSPWLFRIIFSSFGLAYLNATLITLFATVFICRFLSFLSNRVSPPSTCWFGLALSRICVSLYCVMNFVVYMSQIVGMPPLCEPLVEIHEEESAHNTLPGETFYTLLALIEEALSQEHEGSFMQIANMLAYTLLGVSSIIGSWTLLNLLLVEKGRRRAELAGKIGAWMLFVSGVFSVVEFGRSVLSLVLWRSVLSLGWSLLSGVVFLIAMPFLAVYFGSVEKEGEKGEDGDDSSKKKIS